MVSGTTRCQETFFSIDFPWTHPHYMETVDRFLSCSK
jgi:hypothetical protein